MYVPLSVHFTDWQYDFPPIEFAEPPKFKSVTFYLFNPPSVSARLSPGVTASLLVFALAHSPTALAGKKSTTGQPASFAEEFGILVARWNPGPRRIDLVWNSLSESQIVGYNVLRKGGAAGWKSINPAPIQAKNPGQLFGARYKYKDAAVTPGKKFKYRIEIMYADGAVRVSDVEKVRVPHE